MLNLRAADRFANVLRRFAIKRVQSHLNAWPIAEIQNSIFSIDNSSFAFLNVTTFGFLNLFKKIRNLKFGNFDPLRVITASC